MSTQMYVPLRQDEMVRLARYLAQHPEILKGQLVRQIIVRFLDKEDRREKLNE